MQDNQELKEGCGGTETAARVRVEVGGIGTGSRAGGNLALAPTPCAAQDDVNGGGVVDVSYS